MGLKGDTLYIKADQSVEVRKREVTLGDVISMESSNQAIVNRLKTEKLFYFQRKADKENYRQVISILKVIECIHKVYPSIDIQNLGEVDFILTYEDQQTPNKVVHWIKVFGVGLLSMIGAAFSIMSFNNDVATTNLFSQIYELVMGQPSDGFTILELTYSIGLVVGILVFFNHFGKKKFSVDPTPIEVEMRDYENQIQETHIFNYSRKGKEIDVGSSNDSGNHRN